VVTPEGIPVSFDLLPASYHDLTPIHELMERLPSEATVYADKGYNSGDDEAWIEGETGIRLVPRRRENMAPNTLAESLALQRYRGRVEEREQPVGGVGSAAAARSDARGMTLQGVGVVVRPPLRQRRLAITVMLRGW